MLTSSLKGCQFLDVARARMFLMAVTLEKTENVVKNNAFLVCVSLVNKLSFMPFHCAIKFIFNIKHLFSANGLFAFP